MKRLSPSSVGLRFPHEPEKGSNIMKNPPFQPELDEIIDHQIELSDHAEDRIDLMPPAFPWYRLCLEDLKRASVSALSLAGATVLAIRVFSVYC